MFRNTLTASLVLVTALLSVPQFAKADPPDPQPSTPPVSLGAKFVPPEPQPGDPPLSLAAKFAPPDPQLPDPPLATLS